MFNVYFRMATNLCMLEYSLLYTDKYIDIVIIPTV